MQALKLFTILLLSACSVAQAIPAGEHARTIEGIKPPKRARPAIAVIAQNDGTETTDFVVPYAVLVASRAADVFAVATEDRPIKLVPALAIAPQLTTAGFDARYPDGADYVIVPHIEKVGHPDVVAWIQAQARRGAIIVGICSGVQTLAAAGFVDDRNATGHWFDIAGLRKAHPTMRWVRDRRYVVDRGVMTTTGVSASLPASLALVEAFAGRERAASVAAELGVAGWDEQHRSSDFHLDATLLQTAQRNRAAGVIDRYALPVTDGVDDIALAFTADAWSRTLRSQALAVAAGPVTTRYGLTLLPDASGAVPGATVVAPTTLPATLQAIATRYGHDTARGVALQLEFAWRR
jgi:transcriptional regulator GlxA family with amidase domain